MSHAMNAGESEKSIRKPVTFSGIGLHTGESASVTLSPAAAGSGIRIRHRGSPSEMQPWGESHAERRTRVGNGEHTVETVEHLMAAFYGLGITNVDVNVDGREIPVFDGSSSFFVNAIVRSGIERQERPCEVFEVTEPLFFHSGNAVLAAHPCDSFRVTYTLDYNHPRLRAQTVSFDVNEDVFIREIAPARTFCTEEEAHALKDKGFGKGADTTNTLVISNLGPMDNAFRFPDECARHKVLDLIGDLAWAGRRIRGHIIAVRSGHSLNRMLAQQMIKQKEGTKA